jgi:hypothetical protein
MGFPLRAVAAVSFNDIVHRTFSTGDFSVSGDIKQGRHRLDAQHFKLRLSKNYFRATLYITEAQIPIVYRKCLTPLLSDLQTRPSA